jgi:cell division protein FtsA
MNYITAIDLGTTKVVGLVGERTPYGCKVVAYSENPSQGIMRGEVVNINNVLEAVVPCISELEGKMGAKISKVYVGIAGQHIRSNAESNKVNRTNDKQEITWEEIHQMEQNMYTSRVAPGEEILHVIPQCYHVDEYLEQSNPVGMMGKCIEANYRLFVGKTISAEHTKRCIERAGLKLERLILEPLASAKAVLTEDEKELGVAMIDIGGGTTDLLVYYDNVIRHAAVIPFGGNVITEDIRQGCSVPQRQAEQMKIQYGSCFSDLAPVNKTIIIPSAGGSEPREVSFKTLANIIEARMSEIMDAVLYEVQNSGYADKLHAGIVLTGGGALLTHLVQYVKFKTGYNARIAKPFIEDDSCSEVSRSAYSCAVGLLLKGFEYRDAGKGGVREPAFVDLFGESLFSLKKPSLSTPAKTGKPPKQPKLPKQPKPPGPAWKPWGLFTEIFDKIDNQA